MAKVILVAIDFSDISEPVCRLGCDLAKKLEASLHLLHVAAPDPEFVGYDAGPQEVRDTRADALREEHRMLETLKAGCESEGVETNMHLLEGPTADTVLELADKLTAGLIVLGSHGHGAIHNTLLGSVSHDVLKKAHAPIMFLPSKSLESQNAVL